jgi:hypothetical protein
MVYEEMKRGIKGIRHNSRRNGAAKGITEDDIFTFTSDLLKLKLKSIIFVLSNYSL